MFGFLKRRSFLVFLGLLLLALFIWYAGPYFAFADYHPLESALARLIAIALVVGLWALSIVLKRLRANRASDQLVSAVVKQAASEKERPSAEAVQLRERFEEAVAALKQKRRGGHSLYDLPWYVIIGAPGSGKTTALVNSGLNFPLEQRMGKGALRGVGGTRNCDWWFTDEAIFLDTAGRYTTQDSDAAADSAAWTEFLALLKKYRQRRPVNGVILTISAQDLLTQGQSGREAHVAAARRRLTELNKELRIQLPVYLMVTKCDLVAGFSEYFDELEQDGRAQVWGVTFPYDQTLKAEGPKVFPAEFDALTERLNHRLFERLEDERDVHRRAKIFGFPQQMAALRDGLADFINEVFASTRFDQQILLRGVYFTSGTQEGTPIDRLLGAIGRRFAVATEAVVAPRGRGKAYFIERLLKDVLLGESGLAGVNRRLEVQKGALQLAAYAAMVLIAVLGFIAFSVSYNRNRAHVQEVSENIDKLKAVTPIPVTAPLELAVPRLDAVRAVFDSADRYHDEAPLAMRWGLFQGTSLGNAARDAYVRELDGALLPRVKARFEQRLLDYAPEPEKLYEYLKAYLMLGQPQQHLDEKHLAFIADQEWQTIAGANPDAAASLSKHFRSLLESKSALRPQALDESLLAQARSTIRQASIPRLMYGAVKRSKSDDSRTVRLDIAAGVGADQVIKRKSGASLSQPVPALYTKPVFAEVTGGDSAALVAEFTADRWVWGDGGFDVGNPVKLREDMIEVYERDYIATWDAVLNDISVGPLNNLTQTRQALATLAGSGSSSPLRGLLKAVDEHTFLVKPADPAAAKPATGITARIGGLFEKGKAAIGVSAVPPGTRITAHFDPIHRLVAGEQGAAPIDAVVGQIGQISKRLGAMGEGVVGGANSSDPQIISELSGMLTQLERDAQTLPPAVSVVVVTVSRGTSNLVRGDTRRGLEARYAQEISSQCGEVIANHYPFVRSSAVDVPLADFGRIFGYNGLFDQFFQRNLEALVNTTRQPWTWREDQSGRQVGASPTMLRRFEAAKRIRDMYFRPGSQTLEMRFTVTPLELDAGATRFVLEVDGQAFDYRHGPERNWAATWPGPNPGTAAATFEDRSGSRPNIVSQGPWAWFRLMDAGQLQAETDVRYTLTLAKGGHQARVRIEAQSVRNPFAKRDVEQFSCGL